MKFIRLVLPFLAATLFANPRAVLPNAVVDLRTSAGAARVQARWRYSDTSINAIAHRSVGVDLKASGPANRTFDFTPDARAVDFDDSKPRSGHDAAPDERALRGVCPASARENHDPGGDVLPGAKEHQRHGASLFEGASGEPARDERET